MSSPSLATATPLPARSLSFDNRDLSNRIYAVLQQDILQGQLPPGSRLALDELAARFGVSVSPIRDALRLLAADGLVDLRSRRGAFVTTPSPAVIQEVFQFRAILESAAVDAVIAAGPPVLDVIRSHVEAMPATMIGETHADYLTYIQQDQGFHQALVDAIGNTKVSESYAGLASFSLIARMLHRASSHRATETLTEHRAILTALAAGDAPAARAAISVHLHNACQNLVRLADAVAETADRQAKDRADAVGGAAATTSAATRTP